jgi:hypothetical protein
VASAPGRGRSGQTTDAAGMSRIGSWIDPDRVIRIGVGSGSEKVDLSKCIVQCIARSIEIGLIRQCLGGNPKVLL